ncbi:uncharacterized protein [Chelonus insularis]|uniref:uncharacterized protein isoform X2 n=2 Tax=Chelonus insularis TaxID=460826 RepID=UPI00158E0C77|nr:uncharacterized protein LOC118069501 isoform X2 [Chelonus insularis]
MNQQCTSCDLTSSSFVLLESAEILESQAMESTSPIITAQLVLDYLIEKKCYDAARMFQDTSPDLGELVKQMLNGEISTPTLPQSTTETSIPADKNMNLSSILKKQSSTKNEDLKIKKQLHQKRLTKFQQMMSNLSSAWLTPEKKRHLATAFGLTESQIQSWRQKKLKKKKMREKENQIHILKKKLANINNQLAKIEQSEQILNNNEKVFCDVNDPGPSTSQSCFEKNESDDDSVEQII